MIENFALEERHRAHRQAVREFCEEEIIPYVDEYEERGEFPMDVVRKVGEAGLGGVAYPEKYGGAGMDFRSFAITIEEFSRAWKTIGGAISGANTLIGYPILQHGAEWQREEWLTNICTTEWLAALSLTEPNAGSDAASLETTAEKDGDEWVINGHKVWTTHGEIADFILIAARTGEEEGHGGISLIGVPDPLERDGIEFVRQIPCMEGDVAVESEVKYHDLRVPEEYLVGEEGDGFKYVMEGIDVGRVGTGAQGAGVAQAAYEASREFADEREQFGKPIRKFQGISFKLADMKMEIESSRLLTLAAAHGLDRGERVTQEAAMAKTYATDTAMDVATEAVQIHGSRGYSKDYPVERHMRMAKGMQIYEGTNEVNRIVISNWMYRDDD
jgi:alkylation response protein AidB-like acyl-CoA dehydrogenase